MFITVRLTQCKTKIINMFSVSNEIPRTSSYDHQNTTDQHLQECKVKKLFIWVVLLGFIRVCK